MAILTFSDFKAHSVAVVMTETISRSDQKSVYTQIKTSTVLRQ